jgi:hypothetical protein
MGLFNKLLFVISMLTFTSTANAQMVKPLFKELTLAVYIPNDSTNNLAVTINMYFHVNSEGTIHIIMNQMDPTNYVGKPTKYTGFTWDTTYRLVDSTISKLNRIFNGHKSLSAYRIRPKLTTGTSLLRPGTFISYVTPSGATDKIVFGNDAFGRDMNSTLSIIYFARGARIRQSTGVYHDRALEAEILKDHLACNCIPAVDAPPTVKHLVLKN